MKKSISILLVMVWLFSMLTACAKEEPSSNEELPKAKPTYEVFEVGDYDYSSEAEHEVEVNVSERLEEFQDANKVGTTKTATMIDGAVITGTYKETIQYNWPGATRERYEYLREDGTGHTVFEWNEEAKRIEFYSKMYFQTSFDDSFTPKSEEELLTIARTVLSVLVDDPEEYVLRNSDPEIENFEYYLKFSQKIGTMWTEDEVAVSIKLDGEVTHYAYWGGSLKGAERPDDETISLIQSKMDEKILKIYEKCLDTCTLDYKWSSVEKGAFELIRVHNGKVALLGQVHIDILNKETGEKKYDDIVELLVYLE